MCKKPYKDNQTEGSTTAAAYLEAAKKNDLAAASTRDAAHACLLGINGSAGVQAYENFSEAAAQHRAAADIFYRLAAKSGAHPKI